MPCVMVGTELLFAEIANDGPLATVSHELAAHEMDRLVRVFRDVDAALEWCEDQLLVEMLKIAPEHEIRAGRSSTCSRA